MKVLLLLLLLGCVTTSRVYDTDFKVKVAKYAIEFYKDFPYATKSEIYVERTIDQSLHGRCMPDAKVSILNPYSTTRFTDGQIQFLVYHELGHCALDLPHDNVTTVMGSRVFPKKFTIHDVIEMRAYHKTICQGKIRGVRSQAFGPTEKLHESCFRKEYMEDWGD